MSFKLASLTVLTYYNYREEGYIKRDYLYKTKINNLKTDPKDFNFNEYNLNNNKSFSNKSQKLGNILL